MTKTERNQLESLSKLVYGSKGKYLKLLNQGELREMEEIQKDGTIRKYKGYYYSSITEVKEQMEKTFKEKLEEQEKQEVVKKVSEVPNV